ncbi:aspartyl-phosphate phosphatase Spo0E family protein [Aquibacillus salsiterrae]|uniref:Aspartyl-phosphate phosphatase Spo0E family protein n=1 Tax=Aquibacillus salsiterrae TaxID=2950439 RepID=A0A9X4AFB6_9BACI|nr:aspartyl-phosphate phosphatase Spo0E family protein [Aquibacillus salsiterrae]MDC3415883.1 aspartyl-phosphate phosphatase Spo0E family protein [Aquibacillus salsiterrae]
MEKGVESKIEKLRLEMYKAYSNDPDGDHVIKISQELDRLILEVMDKQWSGMNDKK